MALKDKQLVSTLFLCHTLGIVMYNFRSLLEL